MEKQNQLQSASHVGRNERASEYKARDFDLTPKQAFVAEITTKIATFLDDDVSDKKWILFQQKLSDEIDVNIKHNADGELVTVQYAKCDDDLQSLVTMRAINAIAKELYHMLPVAKEIEKELGRIVSRRVKYARKQGR
jgi:hypothetical protein